MRDRTPAEMDAIHLAIKRQLEAAGYSSRAAAEAAAAWLGRLGTRTPQPEYPDYLAYQMNQRP